MPTLICFHAPTPLPLVTIHAKAALPSEHNQVRVQRNRQQYMPSNTHRERVNSDKAIDAPLPGHHRRHNRHHRNARKAIRKRPLESLQYSRNLLEEAALLGLLGRRAPAHLDAEQVGSEGLRDVHAETAEEDSEEGDPGEVFEEGGQETLFTGAPAEEGEGDVSCEGEDEDDGDVDAETGHVESFDPATVPALVRICQFISRVARQKSMLTMMK